jgi:hypothetical protein
VRLAPGSGPSYIIHPGVTARGTAELIRSDADADHIAGLRAANPGNWGATGRQTLLDGELGPWVMATHGHGLRAGINVKLAGNVSVSRGRW